MAIPTAILCEVRSCSSPSRRDRTHSQATLQDRYCHHIYWVTFSKEQVTIDNLLIMYLYTYNA